MPVVVISQGRVVVDHGKIDIVRGSGRFIPRKPWCDYVYSRVLQRDKVNINEQQIHDVAQNLEKH